MAKNETPTLSLESMINFLNSKPELLAKGVSAESVAAEAFAGQFVAQVTEVLKNKRDDDAEITVEDMTTATIEFAAKIRQFVKTVKGQENGNAQTKYDREQFEVQTSDGLLNVRLNHNL